MTKQRKLILLATIIGVISTFLPWITVSAGAFGYSVSRSQNGFHGIGILYFILLIAVAVIAAVGDQKEMLQKNMRLMAIGGGALSLVCLLIAFSNAKDETSGSFGVANASIGFGLMLAFLSALAVTAVPIVIKKADESLATDFDQLKSSLKSMQGNISANIENVRQTPAKKQVRMDELEKLITWREEGKISQEEYEDLKSKII